MLLCAASASAEPYVSLRAGGQLWHDQSNRDPLESGSEPGYAVGIAVGDEAGLSDIGMPKSDFALDLEVEATHRREALHGRNARGGERLSADGHGFALTAFSANAWPGWQVTRQLTVYAGGGVGVGLAQALGNTTWAPFWQVGAGARWNFTPELSLELGERSVWLDEVRLRGYRATYERVHGAMLGVRYEWKR